MQLGDLLSTLLSLLVDVSLAPSSPLVCADLLHVREATKRGYSPDHTLLVDIWVFFDIRVIRELPSVVRLE